MGLQPWIAELDAATLRELASLAERRRPKRRVVDPVAAAEALAAMPLGSRPTIGWFRRYTVLVDDDDAPVG